MSVKQRKNPRPEKRGPRSFEEVVVLADDIHKPSPCVNSDYAKDTDHVCLAHDQSDQKNDEADGEDAGQDMAGLVLPCLIKEEKEWQKDQDQIMFYFV